LSVRNLVSSASTLHLRNALAVTVNNSFIVIFNRRA